MARIPLPTLQSRAHPLAVPATQLSALAATAYPPGSTTCSRATGASPSRPARIEVLQVNVGKLCNQTCSHCHVDAGPDRREVMSAETAGQVVELLRRHPIPTLDVTGGAPELNPQFRFLVREAAALGRRVIDRCNLSVLLLPAQRDLVPFLVEHRVEVTASLPSFRASGHRRPARRGDLREEPRGAAPAERRRLRPRRRARAEPRPQPGRHVPPRRPGLARARLPPRAVGAPRRSCSIASSRSPTCRSAGSSTTSTRTGNLQRYMELLVASFNPRAADGVMCRTYLSVGWDGTLYDCDFNQMLAMPTNHGAPQTLGALLAHGRRAPPPCRDRPTLLRVHGRRRLVLRRSGRRVAR